MNDFLKGSANYRYSSFITYTFRLYDLKGNCIRAICIGDDMYLSTPENTDEGVVYRELGKF